MKAWSYNQGNVRDIYWKVIGTKPDKKTVESEVASFRTGDPQVVTINSSGGRTSPRSTSPPIFNFNSNCNLKFRLEFSPTAECRFNEIEGMAIYEAKTAMKELKKGGMKAVLDEMKGQMKLGRTMMKKKRMHLKLDTIQNKAEVKALYRKAKQGKGV